MQPAGLPAGQPAIKLTLQRADGHRQGRLDEVEAPGGPGEVPLLADGDEVLKVAQDRASRRGNPHGRGGTNAALGGVLARGGRLLRQPRRHGSGGRRCEQAGVSAETPRELFHKAAVASRGRTTWNHGTVRMIEFDSGFVLSRDAIERG